MSGVGGTRGDARIVARGFQRYEGPRSGVGGAIRSVSWQSIRSTLGLGRPARYKVFPVAAVVIAYLPAVVFVGVAIVVGDLLDPNEVADYAGYYGFITAAILLIIAFLLPDGIVGLVKLIKARIVNRPDRREVTTDAARD